MRTAPRTKLRGNRPVSKDVYMSHFSRLTLACLLSLTTLAPLSAQTPATDPLPEMATIEQAWKRGDFVTVRRDLERLAKETGTALAQYRYGQVLLEGRGGPRDLNGAVQWLQQAVAQDHLAATTLLARVYLSAPEDQRNPAAAATLLARSAARGDREAQYYLALLSSAGDGLIKDEAAAVNWLLAAAEQDHVAAQYSLSRAYARGAGTPENPAKALHWMTRAAEAGHGEAQFYLALTYERGQGVAQSLSAALRWYRASAESGFILAQRILGTRYMLGDGVEQNFAEALRWLTAAAEGGEPGAMSNLGYIYATGSGVPVDTAIAATWYTRASAAGVGSAMLALGRFYETGNGVVQDTSKALRLYQQAAAQDSSGAHERLVEMTLTGALQDLLAPHQMVPWMVRAASEDGEDGENTAQALAWIEARAADNIRPAQTALALLWLQQGENSEAASALLTLAASGGDPQAQLRLGQLFTTGTGVTLDYVQAHSWLNIAAASGAAEAANHRDVVAQLMTPEQIAEAQTAARDFFDSASALPTQDSQ